MSIHLYWNFQSDDKILMRFICAIGNFRDLKRVDKSVGIITVVL